MVLLCGIPGDKPFEMIADALDKIGSPYIILNQQQFLNMEICCAVTNKGFNGELRIGNDLYPLQNFSGVYNRMVGWQELPSLKEASPAGQEHCANFHELLFNWLEIAECRVMNTNSAMSSNCSKPYQSIAIAKMGFKIPATLITNEPGAVAGFYTDKKTVIFKSISGVRSIVHELEPVALARLPMIQTCPTMFQEKLTGNNLRVHVVGEKCFAHIVTSDIVDYRYAATKGGTANIEAYELDDEIEKACIGLSKELRLPLAGIDLFVTTQREYYCFEVNPSPGFSYFEENTGQPIAAAIAVYLSGE